jgi:hypothetical protein
MFSADGRLKVCQLMKVEADERLRAFRLMEDRGFCRHMKG